MQIRWVGGFLRGKNRSQGKAKPALCASNSFPIVEGGLSFMNHDWKAIARKFYPGAHIEGDGRHAVVVRCALPTFTSVHLFATWKEANDFAGAQCGFACLHKHSQGNLEVYLPHPRPLRGENLRNYLEAD
jgi:hypothetical protein